MFYLARGGGGSSFMCYGSSTIFHGEIKASSIVHTDDYYLMNIMCRVYVKASNLQFRGSKK